MSEPKADDLHSRVILKCIKCPASEAEILLASNNHLKNENARESHIRLPNLIYADYSHNNFHSVNGLWKESPTLWNLNISNNSLSSGAQISDLPKVVGCLDLSGNEITKNVGECVEALCHTHFLRLKLWNVHPKSFKKYPRYTANDEILHQLPLVYVFNDDFIRQHDRQSAKPPTKQSSWGFHAMSTKEAKVLRALQSIPPKSLDADLHLLDIVFEDYLEEAYSHNLYIKEFCLMPGEKRKPYVDMDIILSIPHQTRNDLSVLLTASILFEIPSDILFDVLALLLSVRFSVDAIQEIVQLPTFAKSALVCLMKRISITEMIECRQTGRIQRKQVLGSAIKHSTVDQYDYTQLQGFTHLLAVKSYVTRCVFGSLGKTEQENAIPKEKELHYSEDVFEAPYTDLEIEVLRHLPDIPTLRSCSPNTQNVLQYTDWLPFIARHTALLLTKSTACPSLVKPQVSMKQQLAYQELLPILQIATMTYKDMEIQITGRNVDGRSQIPGAEATNPRFCSTVGGDVLKYGVGLPKAGPSTFVWNSTKAADVNEDRVTYPRPWRGESMDALTFRFPHNRQGNNRGAFQSLPMNDVLSYSTASHVQDPASGGGDDCTIDSTTGSIRTSFHHLGGSIAPPVDGGSGNLPVGVAHVGDGMGLPVSTKGVLRHQKQPEHGHVYRLSLSADSNPASPVGGRVGALSSMSQGRGSGYVHRIPSTGSGSRQSSPSRQVGSPGSPTLVPEDRGSRQLHSSKGRDTEQDVQQQSVHMPTIKGYVNDKDWKPSFILSTQTSIIDQQLYENNHANHSRSESSPDRHMPKTNSQWDDINHPPVLVHPQIAKEIQTANSALMSEWHKVNDPPPTKVKSIVDIEYMLSEVQGPPGEERVEDAFSPSRTYVPLVREETSSDATRRLLAEMGTISNIRSLNEDRKKFYDRIERLKNREPLHLNEGSQLSIVTDEEECSVVSVVHSEPKKQDDTVFLTGCNMDDGQYQSEDDDNSAATEHSLTQKTSNYSNEDDELMQVQDKQYGLDGSHNPLDAYPKPNPQQSSTLLKNGRAVSPSRFVATTILQNTLQYDNIYVLNDSEAVVPNPKALSVRKNQQWYPCLDKVCYTLEKSSGNEVTEAIRAKSAQMSAVDSFIEVLDDPSTNASAARMLNDSPSFLEEMTPKVGTDAIPEGDKEDAESPGKPTRRHPVLTSSVSKKCLAMKGKPVTLNLTSGVSRKYGSFNSASVHVEPVARSYRRNSRKLTAMKPASSCSSLAPSSQIIPLDEAACLYLRSRDRNKRSARGRLSPISYQPSVSQESVSVPQSPTSGAPTRTVSRLANTLASSMGMFNSNGSLPPSLCGPMTPLTLPHNNVSTARHPPASVMTAQHSNSLSHPSSTQPHIGQPPQRGGSLKLHGVPVQMSAMGAGVLKAVNVHRHPIDDSILDLPVASSCSRNASPPGPNACHTSDQYEQLASTLSSQNLLHSIPPQK